MEGILSNNEVLVDDSRAVSKLYGQRAYGKVVNSVLHLSPLEACYLMEREKLDVRKGKKEVPLEKMKELAGEGGDFIERFCVYSDLRDRGYIVKTGFKYGCHFRVYRNSIEDHAEYLVHAFFEKKKIGIQTLMAHARLSHSVRKKMVFALVDDEHDVSYLTVERTVI